MSSDHYIQGKFRGLDLSARLNGTDSSAGRRGAKGLWDQHHQLAAEKLVEDAVDKSEPMHASPGKASKKGKSKRNVNFFPK